MLPALHDAMQLPSAIHRNNTPSALSAIPLSWELYSDVQGDPSFLHSPYMHNARRAWVCSYNKIKYLHVHFD